MSRRFVVRRDDLRTSRWDDVAPAALADGAMVTAQQVNGNAVVVLVTGSEAASGVVTVTAVLGSGQVETASAPFAVAAGETTAVRLGFSDAVMGLTDDPTICGIGHDSSSPWE